MSVSNLDIVAENVIVAYFERRNRGCLYFAGLQTGKIVLALICNLAQAVELFIDSCIYDVATTGRAAGSS